MLDRPAKALRGRSNCSTSCTRTTSRGALEMSARGWRRMPDRPMRVEMPAAAARTARAVPVQATSSLGGAATGPGRAAPRAFIEDITERKVLEARWCTGRCTTR